MKLNNILNKVKFLKQNRKKLCSKVLLLCLSFNMGINSLGRVVKADSLDRTSVYINFASGKHDTSIDLDKLSLSKKDLQFLGVYISNFFVPFATELGVSDDVTSMNKEDIKKALQTNLKFNDALADNLTETLIGLSRSSVKELTLCVSKDYQSNLVPVNDMPLNYYTALSSMLGGLKTISSWYPEEANSVIKGIEKGEYDYGYFAYKIGDKYIPVFDFDIDMSSLTPSAAAFIKCLESTDIENGYGFNFLDLTQQDGVISEKDFKEFSEKVTDSQLYEMSIYGTRLAVDCFGNIILMGSNHQFIAVPGAMNPYTWVGVDEKGKDIGKGIGGTAYNVANIPSMALQENSNGSNKLFSSYSGVSNTVKNGKLVTDVLADKLNTIKAGYSKSDYSLRKIRGVNDSSLSSGIFDLFTGSDFRDLSIRAINGYKSANKNAYNYFSLDDSFLIGRSGYIEVPGAQVVTIRNSGNVDIFDSFVYIDNLGAAHFDDSGQKVDFNTFNIVSYLSDHSLPSVRDSMSSWGNSPDNGFTNTYRNIKNGSMVVSPSVSKESLVSLYVTYCFSALYDENSSSDKEKKIGKLGYRMNNTTLPSIPDEPLVLPYETESDIMLTSIRDWTYYLLHPSEGKGYFKTWIKNKINSFLVGWHDDMVGTNGTGSINGSTKYRGTSGYVTSPELSDIPWTDSLLRLYSNAVPFLLVGMIVVMLGAYIVGVLSLQKAIIGFLIFCISAQMPTAVINGVVGTSNRFSSNLYGEKFTYWALVQHESYSNAIDEASSSDNYTNYLKTLHDKNSQATANQGGESVMLRWQAPKKMASLMLSSSDKSVFSSNSSKLLSGLINSTYGGESYLDDSDSVYLYRSYIDIANFSKYIHRGLEGTTPKQPKNLNITNDVKSAWSEGLKKSFANYSSVYENDRTMGYANKNADGSTSGLGTDILRVRLPLSSSIVSDAYSKAGTIKDMTIGEYVGINQDAFNFSIPMFNVGSSVMDFPTVLKTDNFNASRYSGEDFSALASYALMSESPFYYFSWYLYETGLSTDSKAHNGYKNLLLGEDNAGFFYNTQGNGELKDFMDMRSLFTYIIPYLKQGNDIVKEWDETYGIYIHDGVPTEEGHQDDADIKSNPELQQKYWHNLNVARLYNIYSPWVDIMYDCSYAKPEKIRYLGESYVIEDPINPASYPEERPMIFSRSEMVDYGLKENQLTKVEKLILKAQKGMQERLFKLLNYYSFGDTVLNTASSMNCVFEFNTVFSENSLFGANHNIYPQAFELRDFSYDAFLRFILANSTGESMLVDGNSNFYEGIVERSSMTTILVMLILDIISVYIMPALKIFFIVGMFVLSVLIILMTSFKVDPRFNFVKRLINSFIVPMIKFLGINCGLAFIVSLFMGEGSNLVTGDNGPSISLGDPVMVMLIMVLLNSIVLYLLFKLLITLWRDVKVCGKSVGNFLVGVAGSVGGLVTTTAVAKSKNVMNSSQSVNNSIPSYNAQTRGKSFESGSEVVNRKSPKMSRGISNVFRRNKAGGGISKTKETREAKSSKINSKITSGLKKIVKKKSK